MKVIDPAQLQAHLAKFLKPGDGIVMSQGTGEPQTLTEALVKQWEALGPSSLFVGASGFTQTFADAGTIRLAGYGAGGSHRALAKLGMLEYFPLQVSQMPKYLGVTIPCDVAFISVGPARSDGSYSYSLVSDYTVDAVRKARVVIAESNDLAPDTHCDETLSPEQITVLVNTRRALPQVAPAEITELDRRIAAHVAEFIPDRSTLQIGTGAIPEAIIALLQDRRDLGLHTGVIGDSILELIDRGVVTGAAKEVDAGVAVTGCLWGTDRLYRHVHCNPGVRLSRLCHTHANEILSRFSALVAVNSALEVDLTGQVNAESLGENLFGAIGGQIDYVRAASRSENGASIIALPSTASGGRISRIVPRLSGPVTTARGEVDVIATENGAVRLRGRSLRERVRLMISIADDSFREELERWASENLL